MIVQEFYLEEYDWSVHMFYVEERYCISDIIGELEGIGASDESLDEMLSLMERNEYNAGITYTNPSLQRSIVVIGPTTCAAEFMNTLDHEKCHLAMHITQTIDIEPFSEDCSSLIGCIGQKMFTVARRFLCDHCR